jgi:hypothetical protein
LHRPRPPKPYGRFSRIRLSSRQFLHRDCLAVLPGGVKREQPGIRESGIGRFDAVTSADNMRSAHTPASTHDSWLWLASLQPCLASSALAVLLCPGIDFTHPPSCPAFPRMGFAGPSSRGPCTRPQQYYAGSDSSPARTRRQGLSAYFALPSEHPTPNHAMGPAITSHPRRCDRPGATTQASSRNRRLAAPRRRNGFVILRAARSPPAAPHPASRKQTPAVGRRSCLQLHVA